MRVQGKVDKTLDEKRRNLASQPLGGIQSLLGETGCQYGWFV